MSDCIGQTEVNGLAPNPDIAREQVDTFWEFATAPCFDLLDEVVVDNFLKCLETLDILGFLRPKRIHEALALPGGVDPSLDTVLAYEFVQTEAGRDHTD